MFHADTNHGFFANFKFGSCANAVAWNVKKGGDFGWRLHEGFNAQFGMSLTAGLGKHAPRGVGFGQSAAFAYVWPLSKKLSFAAGITATNFNWARFVCLFACKRKTIRMSITQ